MMRNGGSSHDALYLSRTDVEAVGLTMAEMVAAVEGAFCRRGRGEVVMPAKVTMEGAGGAFAQVMPAWMKGSVLGVKLVTVVPENPARGLPVTNALIVLNDAGTGLPTAILDGGLLTALRTGASVGVAARHLAAPGVTTVGMLGCGVQARTSVRALAVVLPELREVRCHDVSAAARAAFVEELPDLLAADRSAAAAATGGSAADRPGGSAMRATRGSATSAAHASASLEASPGGDTDGRPRIVACDRPKDICRGAGVVVSAISMSAGGAPTLGAGSLEPGGLAVALDYDAAWTPAAMAECERFFTDDLTQTRATRAHGSRLGRIPDRIDGDLGELVAGRTAGRTSPAERIFCLNLGIAAEDVACALLVLERARLSGIGTRLPF